MRESNVAKLGTGRYGHVVLQQNVYMVPFRVAYSPDGDTVPTPDTNGPQSVGRCFFLMSS